MNAKISENLSIKVRVIGPAHEQSEGVVQLQTWNKKERTRRAIKILAMCWAASIGSIILPIVHFLLVPGFFLGGIVAAFYITSQTSVIVGGEGKCPRCQEILPIARAADKWPINELCSKCQSALTIERA